MSYVTRDLETAIPDQRSHTKGRIFLEQPVKHHKKRKRIQMSESNAVMIALTASGGLQDAYSYFVRGKVFANAQTGNLVLMAQHLFTGDLTGALHYLIPLSAFAFGVLVAEQLRARIHWEGMIHWRQVIILLQILMLLAVGFLPVNDVVNVFANALTSMACAMQVQAFRKVNGYAYASTMCIGNLRSGMDALSAYLRTKEQKHLRRSGQYFLVILVFVLGAGSGGFLASRVGAGEAPVGGRIIWISCGLLIISFLLMLIREEEEIENAAG
jgi:uncharacterized membrane protein YoaK (UPF0700 family)